MIERGGFSSDEILERCAWSQEVLTIFETIAPPTQETLCSSELSKQNMGQKYTRLAPNKY